MKSKFIGKRVIVRAYEAGVYYGTLVRKEGDEVELHKARNIWRWSGAASLFQLAEEGVKNPDDCRFTQFIDSLEIMKVCQIIPCTGQAIANIEAVKAWRV